MTKSTKITAIIAFLFAASIASADEDSPTYPPQKSKTIFTDDFNRNESDNTLEEIGPGWWSNSPWRAEGRKQADLTDGLLNIKTAEGASHIAVIRRVVPFNNGMIKSRIRMTDKRGIHFNFYDPKCKTVHAGHICRVSFKPGSVELRDEKTGVFDLKIREKIKSGSSKNEIKKLTEGTIATFDAKLSTQTWHDVTIIFLSNSITAYVDGEKIGGLRSKGIGHNPKREFAFSVPGSADIDSISFSKPF